MSLDAETAAAIAARHGLGIEAAVSLRLLADTPQDAERIARQFAPAPTLDESMARKAEQLADLHRRTDTNGRVRPAADLLPPAPAAQAPVGDLRSGTTTGTGGDPAAERAAAIAAAEQAGDWTLAGQLKAQRLTELRAEMEQQQP